ncbi:MAG: hypothetical protein BRC50_01955 [Cyanobacteria bacterium SW_11_48_12]|nr:MAG: hypothetical protein BRC50_01955 [Cyanobacteria bacterium SW_11_48_12]
MSSSPNKRGRWVYVVLVIVVLAFVSISTLPLLKGILGENQPSVRTTTSPTQPNQPDLEAKAEGYKTVLQREPGNVAALRGLAKVRLQQDNFEAAIAPLQKLAKLNPQQTSVQLLLAKVYTRTQNYDEAITTYNQAIKSDKQNFRPVLGKALVLQRQGKQAEAQSLLTKAVSLAPPKYKDKIKQMTTQPGGGDTEGDKETRGTSERVRG